MFTSKGILKYEAGHKLALYIDPEIARYYRSFIPKTILFHTSKYRPHLTVIRTGREKPVNNNKWGLYRNFEIEFQYDPYIYIEDVYIWINASSERLEEIRLELGLPRHYSYSNKFHITIANRKEQNKEID